MSKILVPIDFSEASLNALEFAVGISKNIGTSVTLFHTEPLPVVPAVEAGMMTTDIQWQKENFELAKSRLEILAAKYNCHFYADSFEMLELETNTAYGSLVEITKQILEDDPEYNLVVMGTNGASSRFQEWLGTHTTDLLENLDIPMLVIPKSVKFRGIRNIVYATEKLSLNECCGKDLQEFADYFDAQLSLVNIEKTKNNDSEVLDVKLTDKFRLSQHLHFTQIKHKNIEEALLQFSEQEYADILAVKRPERGLIEGIFHKSLSRKLALHSKVPVLIMRSCE